MPACFALGYGVGNQHALKMAKYHDFMVSPDQLGGETSSENAALNSETSSYAALNKEISSDYAALSRERKALEKLISAMEFTKAKKTPTLTNNDFKALCLCLVTHVTLSIPCSSSFLIPTLSCVM